MKTRMFLLVFVLLAVLMFAVMPTLAQEEVDTVVIEADDVFGPEEALAAILALAAAVAYAMELVKTGVIKPLLGYADVDTEQPLYVVVVQVVAFVLALLTIFALNDPRANVLTAFGVFPDAPLWFAQVLTALAVSWGNLFLHGVADYFDRARGRVPAT